MTGGSPVYVRDSNSSRLIRKEDTREQSQTPPTMEGGQEDGGGEGEELFQVFSNPAQKEKSVILEIASVRQKLAEAWEIAEQEKWSKKLQELEDSLAKLKNKNNPKKKMEDGGPETKDKEEGEGAGESSRNNLTFADDLIDFPWADFSRDSDEETFRNVTDAIFVQVSDRVSLLREADAQVKSIFEYHNSVVVEKQEYIKEEYSVFRKAEKNFSRARAELALILHKMLTYFEKLKQAQGLPAFSPELQDRVRKAAREVKNTANPSESNLVHKVIAGDIKKQVDTMVSQIEAGLRQAIAEKEIQIAEGADWTQSPGNEEDPICLGKGKSTPGLKAKNTKNNIPELVLPLLDPPTVFSYDRPAVKRHEQHFTPFSTNQLTTPRNVNFATHPPYYSIADQSGLRTGLGQNQTFSQNYSSLQKESNYKKNAFGVMEQSPPSLMIPENYTDFLKFKAYSGSKNPISNTQQMLGSRGNWSGGGEGGHTQNGITPRGEQNENPGRYPPQHPGGGGGTR